MITDSACSWCDAGVCTNDARLGTTRAATARAIEVVIMLARAVLKRLGAVAQAAGDEGEAQDEQQVGQDRPDDRRLHDRDQPLAQGEDADEQLGQVAERALQHAGRASPQPVGDLVDGEPDEQGQDGDGCTGHDEGRDVAERGRSG